jgi:hypothetical protein
MSKHGIFRTCRNAFPSLPFHPIDLYSSSLGASSPIDLNSKQHKELARLFLDSLAITFHWTLQFCKIQINCSTCILHFVIYIFL